MMVIHMSKLVLEVGMELNNNLDYYHEMLTERGLEVLFSCVTHDVYYAKESDFDGLSENNIKKSCERIRYVRQLNSKEKKNKEYKENKNKEKALIKKGYIKVFDTTKIDFQYGNATMKSRIQLQAIKGIGLLVYYDNPDYYEYDEDTQRRMLLKDLNSYGFDFKESDLGLDKLRTLYYGKKMYSRNQNG